MIAHAIFFAVIGAIGGVFIGMYLRNGAYNEGVAFGARVQQKIDLDIFEKFKADMIRVVKENLKNYR